MFVGRRSGDDDHSGEDFAISVDIPIMFKFSLSDRR